MNSCILIAEIVQDPQLRYTSDNMAIAEMMVQFPGLRADDPPAMLKVVGWGNLAQEIQQNYHQGDKVILEGRLAMNTVERPEGFKEKRAELTVQRIHALGAGVNITTSAARANPATPTPEPTIPTSAPPVVTEAPRPVTTTPASVGVPNYDLSEPTPPPPSYERHNYPLPTTTEDDIDDIPF